MIVKSFKCLSACILVMMLILSSCAKNRSVEDVSQAEVKITSSEIVSRAAGTEWWNDDEVGIFMIVDNDSESSVYNARYVNDGADGATAIFNAVNEKIYHPVDVTATYFAYYPYTNSLVNNKYPIDTKTQADLSKIDLMVSDNEVVSYANSSSGVDLSFKHQLSNIKIEIIPGYGFIRDNFDGIEAKLVGLVTEGSYDLMASSDQITPASTVSDIDLVVESQGSENQTIEAIIIPQSGSGINLTFAVVNSGNYSAGIPQSTTFEAGKQYVYKVTINQDHAEVETTFITDWVAGNNGGQDFSADKDDDSSDSGSDSSGGSSSGGNSDADLDIVTIDLSTINTLALLEDEIKTTYSAGARGYTLTGSYIAGMLGSGTSASTSLFSQNAPDLESLDLSGVIGLQLTAYSFESSKLSKIVLPTTITEIPAYTFANCTALEDVNIENVTNLGDYTFSKCSSLTELKATNVTSLGNYCFEYCTSLTSLKLLSKDLAISSVTENTFTNFTTTDCVLTLNSDTSLSVSGKICFGNISWLNIVAE